MNWKTIIRKLNEKIGKISVEIFGWILAISFLVLWTLKVFIEFFPFILIISLPFIILFDIWIGFFYIFYGIIIVLCGYKAFYKLEYEWDFD